MAPSGHDPDPDPVLSLAEHAVLGLVAEGRPHGFAVARLLAPDGEVGRVYSVARPAVYRAVERLIDARLIEPQGVEPGDRGPRRTPLRITPEGRRRLAAWLNQPVDHVRSIRTGFLVKLMLLDRAGADPAPLIASQIDAIRPIVASIEDRHRHSAGRDRAASLWRVYSARAALQFLVELAAEEQQVRADPGP